MLIAGYASARASAMRAGPRLMHSRWRHRSARAPRARNRGDVDASTGRGLSAPKVNFLRPLIGGGRLVVADGTVTHHGRTLAVATADAIGSDGKKMASAMGSTMILPERPI